MDAPAAAAAPGAGAGAPPTPGPLGFDAQLRAAAALLSHPSVASGREAALRFATVAAGRLRGAAASLDARLAATPPHLVVLATLLLSAALFTLFDAAAACRAAVRRAGGLRAATFRALKALPGVAALVAAKQASMLAKLDAGAKQRAPRRAELPPQGVTAEQVLAMTRQMAEDEHDVTWTPGESQLSGALCLQGSGAARIRAPGPAAALLWGSQAKPYALRCQLALLPRF